MKVDLTDQQIRDFATICDAAVRHEGIVAAKVVVPLLNHLQAAMDAEKSKGRKKLTVAG